MQQTATFQFPGAAPDGWGEFIEINCEPLANLRRFVPRHRRLAHFARPITPLFRALVLGTALPVGFYFLGLLPGAVAAAYLAGSYATAFSIEVHARGSSRQNILS
jgi:hypothetical protein